MFKQFVSFTTSHGRSATFSEQTALRLRGQSVRPMRAISRAEKRRDVTHALHVVRNIVRASCKLIIKLHAGACSRMDASSRDDSLGSYRANSELIEGQTIELCATVVCPNLDRAQFRARLHPRFAKAG